MTHRRTDRPFRGDERIETSAKATELYKAGHTIRCVSTQIDRPYSTTRNLLAEADIVFRPRGTAPSCSATHTPRSTEPS
ncbi:helix-turn-helix domain-containing protein [Streptomyces sp. NPDC058424]|uniref:helix-turn-helix domain-containing protein n=1 Tax=Streptomyces sp. NPDC058424 TaxID=3346491 RepID=UPI003661A528